MINTSKRSLQYGALNKGRNRQSSKFDITLHSLTFVEWLSYMKRFLCLYSSISIEKLQKIIILIG